MDISIIIVNWNTRDLLAKCLQSIDVHRGSLAIQTIVVDNDSADGSREVVASRYPWAELVNSGGNIGFARANNLALPRVSAPVVLYLNPDTEVRAGALEGMLDFLQKHQDVGAIGCRLVDGAGRVQELGLQWFPSPLTELVRFLLVSNHTYRKLRWLFPYQDPGASAYVKKLYGACLMVRKPVLDQVGAFDEQFFMYCEDVDLCYRILAGGWKIYYLSEVDVLHWGGSASATVPGRFSVLMMCESFSKFMRKHHGTIGSSGYRCVTFLGAQARLLILFGLRATRFFRRDTLPTAAGLAGKYLTILRWALGLEKPVIRG